jgi:hypothetical protein
MKYHRKLKERYDKKDPFVFKYYCLRNISSPEDGENGRKVFVGQAPIRSIIDLPTDENVREYLLEAEGRIRRKPTQVHRAIKDTLENASDNFSVYNSGIVIVARECNIFDKERYIELFQPSIINGSQTQGIIKDHLKKELVSKAEEKDPTHIKYEIIVTDEEGLIAETSIARNFQNDVMTISIAGRLGQLDELEKSLQEKKPGKKLRKSETKLSEDFIKTERLLQVITALAPEELWYKGREFNKVYTYSQKTKCLREFQEIFEKAKNDSNPSQQKTFGELYQFYLDVAAQALDLYDLWKSHQDFRGTRIRAIEREGRKITEVPDGIVFPILASLSAFATKSHNGWEIKYPPLFSEKELIKAADSAYKEIANSNPNTMGKSRACYSSLYQITSIYKRLTDM